MNTFNYFAYGSNMLLERLINRCPNAVPAGQVLVKGFRLSFSKKSVDGSGKATLVKAVNCGEIVHGVVFRIPLTERDDLDAEEGQGYKRYDTFSVVCAVAGIEIVTTAYIAEPDACDESRRPYDWYRDLVLSGAIQNRLPASWIVMLREIPTWPDPKPDRETRLKALGALKQAVYAGGVLHP
jgi:hypothetical protein